MDEHGGRKEDKARWDRPDLPAPMPAGAHVSADAHPDDDDEPSPQPDYPEGGPVRWVDDPIAHVQPTPPPKPKLVVIVVGSSAWTNRGTVTDALHSLWQQHGEPDVQLVTSGSPLGAEPMARELAEGFGWDHAQLRDENLDQVQNALVLGFLVGESTPSFGHVGSAEIIDWLSRKFWTRIYREETIRQTSPWANR